MDIFDPNEGVVKSLEVKVENGNDLDKARFEEIIFHVGVFDFLRFDDKLF